MDRQREELTRVKEREEETIRRKVEDETRQREALQERRRWAATQLNVENPDAKARISMRLPAGQRIERRFAPDATLADIYAWAECAAYLPEYQGRGLEIPAAFTLKTSFPSCELVDKDRTIEELQLAGSNILLAAIEED